MRIAFAIPMILVFGLLMSGCDGNSSSSRACAISVQSPVTGDRWLVGETHTVAWLNQGGCSNSVDLELWRNKSLVTTIANGVPNSGQYDWLVGDYDLGLDSICQVRVIDQGSGVLAESEAFAIGNSLPCTINLTDPDVGDTLIVGDLANLRYSWNGSCPEQFVFELWKGDSYVCEVGRKGHGSSGASDLFLWTVTDCGMGLGSDYTVRVHPDGSDRYDQSDLFTISPDPCAISVLNPTEGASWFIHDSITISWSTTGTCIGTFEILLYRGGGECALINRNIPNNGAYDWHVFWCNPFLPADYDIRVRESLTGRTGRSGTFSVSSLDSFAVIYPDSATVWDAPASVGIYWYTNNLGGEVDVTLWKGNTQYRVLYHTVNDGAQPLSLAAAAPGTNYRIRIEHDSGVVAFSDYFSIQ